MQDKLNGPKKCGERENIVGQRCVKQSHVTCLAKMIKRHFVDASIPYMQI